MLSRNSVFSQMYYQPAGPDCQNPHKMGTVVNWKGLATVRAAARVLQPFTKRRFVFGHATVGSIEVRGPPAGAAPGWPVPARPRGR